jgi:hypothetical protein
VTNKSPSDNDAGGEQDRLNVDYIKSNHFRTIAPSGMMGSVTPQGMVQVALFSERQAIPQRVVYSLMSDGSMGNVIERIGRDAVVREVEVAITLDIETATIFCKHLEDLIKEIKAIEMPGSNK